MRGFPRPYRLTRVAPARGDAGVSLIEVLIAVVLIGSVVTATLTTLVTTINASSLDRDHANAHAWLQTAADMLYARDVWDCRTVDDFGNPIPPSVEIAAAIADYQTTVANTDNPEGWPASNIEVTGIDWWSYDIDQATGITSEAWSSTCDEKTTLQRVGLRVRATDGRIVEEVEVIIGG